MAALFYKPHNRKGEPLPPMAERLTALRYLPRAMYAWPLHAWLDQASEPPTRQTQVDGQAHQ